MTIPTVSFVIPYYKTGVPLLNRTVKSVTQIGSDIDYEIWIIDDGTPTQEAKNYVQNLLNPHIHYYFQPNCGLGGARNTGIRLSTKNYIQFIDSDDAIFPKAERMMLRLLKMLPPEILSFNFKKVKQGELKEKSNIHPKIHFRGEGAKFILSHNLHGAAWGYIFNKRILQDLRFTPHIFHEDEEFTAQLFTKAHDVIVTNIPVYAYTQRLASIVHNKSEEIITKRFTDLLNIILRLKDKSLTLPDPQQKALRKRADELCMAMLFNLLRDSYDKSFLQNQIEKMQQNGLYPLPRRPYYLPYQLVRISTLSPMLAQFTAQLFRLLKLNNI